MTAVTFGLKKQIDTVYKTTLGDSGDYKLRIYWNSVSEVWLLDMLTGNDEAIFYGQTLIQNIDLLKPWRNLSTPRGVLMIHDRGDKSGFVRTITYDNIEDFVIYYTEV